MEVAATKRCKLTMGFKLPHDVVSACAKRDEPPSRRRQTAFAELKA